LEANAKIFDNKDIPEVLLKADIIVKVQRSSKEQEKLMLSVLKDSFKPRVLFKFLESESIPLNILNEWASCNITAFSVDKINFNL